MIYIKLSLSLKYAMLPVFKIFNFKILFYFYEDNFFYLKYKDKMSLKKYIYPHSPYNNFE